ncbi:hypothetical protein [Blastopirellula retiformator]|uniref:hypothetical protein n=1 Tax=Blastopirellula retiformator TaxID=2527970 RepID=UPI0016440F0D|nr:hypothetical protein [Blastopirellula retiformator]
MVRTISSHGEVFWRSGIGFFRYWRKAYGRFLRLMGGVHEAAASPSIASDQST